MKKLIGFSLAWMRRVDMLMGVLAVAYAFFWLVNLEISRSAEILLLLTFLFSWGRDSDRATKYSWVFMLLIAFVVLQIFVHQFSVVRFPADESITSERHYTKLFLCLMIAWWVKGSSSRALTILMATLAGFWVSLIWQGDWQSWWAGIQGKRVDFDYHNAQHTSVYFGWALIAALTWLGHLVSSHGRAWQLSLSVLLSLVALVGVIVTQTRGVWLALAVVFVLIAPYLCYRLFRLHHGKATKPRTLFLMVAIVMAFLAFGATQFDRLIEKRLDKEASVMQTAAELDWDSIPYSSIGIRLHTWRYALEKIAERPLTGWGADSRKYLIDEGPFPQAIRDRFGHFHNSYIEITLAYGLIGLTILGILCGAMWEGVRQAYKRGHRYLATGLACSFVFFAIANLTESYFIFRTGMYFVTIVGGCALSFYLFRPGAKGAETASSDAKPVRPLAG